MLSKGEAEAKALALRADAYRQFNEAAIIQTVLSQLPDIVRAAAEPMGNIDHLTVLSNDGASDMVKNVTRTVTEAGATVKGLTGIDIPEMLSQAMGGAGAVGRDLGRVEDAPTEWRRRAADPAGGTSTSAGGAASASGGPTAGGRATGGGSPSTTTPASSAAGAGHGGRAADRDGTPPPRFEHAGIGRRGDRRCRAGGPCRLGAAHHRTHRHGGRARSTSLGRDHPRDDRRRRRDPAGGGPSCGARHRALRRGPPQ